MTTASRKHEVFLECRLLEAVRSLQSRARSLTPLERVKLQSLLFNLKAVRNLLGDASADESKEEVGTALQFVTLS
jgi:hypothetical protein